MSLGFHAGDLFSHYRILERIGSGGMGEVFLAEEIALGRKVALKFLNDDISRDGEKLKRFFQEARAASTLNHPNIITVYEVGEFQDVHYIAVEWIDGETLRELINRRPKYDLRSSLAIASQIISALEAAHEAGITHRDIKPENIMVRKDGLVKVLDFGLAKLSSLSAQSVETTMPQLNTDSGIIIGTIAYMSPEQARGRKIDPRSDIFSLGIVFFELFSGKRPFTGETTLELVSSILKDEPPMLRSACPGLPVELERIVSRALHKDPALRYQNIRDMHLDIEDLREDLKGSTRSAARQMETVLLPANGNATNATAFTTEFSVKRRFTLLHASVFVLAAAVLVGAVWFLRPSQANTAFLTNPKVTELASWVSSPGELSGSAAFSPDGKMVAFASTKSGTKSIWITQAAKTEPLQITKDEYSNIEPIWSSKGDEIAYISLRQNAGSNQAGIWRISALGGSPRLVGTVSDASARLRRWTASGRIYYQLGSDLFYMDQGSGSAQKAAAPLDKSVTWVTISPDEKTLALSEESEGNWNIATSDPNGAGKKVVASGAGAIRGSIAWAPESGTFFYTVVAGSDPQMYMVSPASKQSVRLTGPGNVNYVIDADASGHSVLLSSSREESNIWRAGVADGVESPVVRDTNAKLWPVVSNDGRRVAYQIIKGPNSGNKLMSGGVATRELGRSGDAESAITLTEQGVLPAWSPDDSMVAFLRTADNQLDLYLVNSAGGGERKLAAGLSPVGYSISPYNLVQKHVYTWSPQMSAIAYVRSVDGVYNVWNVSVADGTERKVTQNEDPSLIFFCPIYSADGGRIAFSFHQKNKDQNGKTVRGFRVVELSDGRTIDVYGSTDPTRLLGWTADDRSLIFARAGKDASGLPPATDIFTVPLSGGTAVKLVSLESAYYYNIFLSRDRKTIAYAARDKGIDDVWTVPVSGGKPRKLTSNNDPDQFFSRLTWMPDGSAILYGRQTRFSLLAIMTDTQTEGG